MDRRCFLKSMLAAAALGFADHGLRRLPAFAQEGPAGASLLKAIPSSGEKIPAIGLGTSRTFNAGASAAEMAPLREVLRLFFEAGGRVLDTSPMYGRAESVSGVLARDLGITEDLFMATKVWTSGEDAGIGQMNASYEKLGVGMMDLMQIHNLVDWRTHLKTLRRWKEEGKVRYIGVTHYHAGAHDSLEAVMAAEPLDFVQLNYSVAEPEAQARLLPLAAERGIAVLANRPFGAGEIFDRVRGKSLPAWAEEIECKTWAQFFLKYVISHPAVTCAIPATSKPSHLTDNMAAMRGRIPDEALRQKMAAHFASL